MTKNLPLHFTFVIVLIVLGTISLFNPTLLYANSSVLLGGIILLISLFFFFTLGALNFHALFAPKTFKERENLFLFSFTITVLSLLFLAANIPTLSFEKTTFYGYPVPTNSVTSSLPEHFYANIGVFCYVWALFSLAAIYRLYSRHQDPSLC